MADVQPLATSLMPQYEAPADKMLKLGQLAYYNTQGQIAQMNARQTAIRAQATQLNGSLLAAAQNPAATPDATNSTPAAVTAATTSSGLINRTGAPVNGTPTLGAVGSQPVAGQPGQPVAGQPGQPAAAQPGQPATPAAPDVSPAGVRQRYFDLATSKQIPPDIIDATLKAFDANTAGQMAEINLAKASSDARDRDIQNQAFSDAQGDPNATLDLMRKRGATPAAIDIFQNQITATKQHIASLSADQLKNAQTGHDAMRGALMSFIAQPSMLDKTNGWQDFVQQQVANGDLSKAEAANVSPTYPGDDAARNIANSLATGSQLAKEEMERRTANHADAEATETHRHNVATEEQNAKPKTAAELAMAAAGGDPDAALKRLDQYQRAGRPVNITSGPGAATDDDFRRAGEQYARTGVMPPLGMGANGRTQILHYANEWARNAGLSPGQVVSMQAAYAGDKNSLKTFTAQRDQIVSFENTAKKNIDLFLEAASKIPDSGVPWLNTPLRLLDEKLVGKDAMAAVNAARAVATNEIAKVTSGGSMSGVLSDSARQEVKDYNPRDATLPQTLAVVKILKQDMANRHASMDATLDDIRGRLGGGGADSGGATQPKATHRFNPATGHIEEIK
jgi:hypothetical protein